MTSFFRYPGGKSKIQKLIVAELEKRYLDSRIEYREPFFGGGSVGLSFLKARADVSKIWISEKDPALASLWTSVIRNPEVLEGCVLSFLPSIEAFDRFVEELSGDTLPALSTPGELAAYGFKKLAVHQISYSGLGTKSGGPLGGRDQKSKYKIDCRWSPANICEKIYEAYGVLVGLDGPNREIWDNGCTCVDFEHLFYNDGEPVLLYLDPPYYEKGNDLYQYGFSEEDHDRLAALVAETKHAWVLSYDDCPRVRELYAWADITELSVKYSITTSRNRKELLICSKL